MNELSFSPQVQYAKQKSPDLITKSIWYYVVATTPVVHVVMKDMVILFGERKKACEVFSVHLRSVFPYALFFAFISIKRVLTPI